MSTEATAYANLTTGTTVEAACNGEHYVVPCDPTNSLLYQKVNASFPTGCGGRMPRGENALDASAIGMIHDWILQGAAP
ncbi:MAG: hypothetical protein FWD17_10355 [Polyangiaceae bacterium]|nr:hypothetical protein [Polyangiaceae bacterium]